MPFTARHGEVMARIARLQPDLVVADETLLAPFAAFAPARWRIVHTHNHDSSLLSQAVFAGAGEGHARRAAARLERIERQVFPRLDQVWGVRAEDLAAYQEMGVAPDRLFLAPNVIPDPCFEEEPQPGVPGRAVFFGSLWYPPNIQALEWLLEAWPAVRQKAPGATLSVAGRGAPPSLATRAAQTPGVELLGFVPDLKALLRESALAVVPLLQGGGTKIKTLEAMAAGLPILASPVAAEGLALEDGVHAVIREPGEAFLEALAAMIGNPGAWQGLGLKARELARERYSMAALSDCLGQALDRLLV
jgi:glycosyltransferase involved in cell wall biosynthesis